MPPITSRKDGQWTLPDLRLPGDDLLTCDVYAPPRPKQVIHSEVVEFNTKTLRRRTPQAPELD